MLLGPLDRRLERSRCSACAKSHLKCSGGNPCTNCSRRGSSCKYPAKSTAVVKINSANQRTIHNGSFVCSVIPREPIFNDGSNILNIFLTKFVQENSFTGCSSTWFLDIQAHFASSAAVHHAISALSALYASREEGSNRVRNQKAALRAYQTAVKTVRKTIDAEDPNIEQPLLSSTFLLGLFELMYDPTGEGWIQHTMYGTSKILQHLGPDAFRSGLGLNFFHQMRMFEVSRSLIFSESSFLVEAPWRDLMKGTSTDNMSDHPIESLLALMLRCSDHCFRALRYLDPLDTSALSHEEMQQLRAFAVEGFDLRLELCEVQATLSALDDPAKDDRTIVAKIYLAATSIFLSGVYDYRSVWLKHIEAVPTLPQTMIEEHLSTILDLTEYAMARTNLSTLLFLYPLRVACSRVWTLDERDRLRSMLGTSKRSFAVAHVFIIEVEELWITPVSDRYD
ncbi:hypothetical protein D6C98_05487 [Aureobasidium pullulans]|nr:hypothetical protein D6C98_05487 [Aureobasidium pullulans]